ncbi:MAG: ABC transporter ATP-binding protein [Promethearchaeota archaeon]
MSLANKGNSSSPPAIDVDNFSFTYVGTTEPVLRNIALTIQEGEFVLLAGPSGCGKSTLTRSLAGFIPHEFKGDSKGTVRIHGVDTRALPIYELAKTISLVQQDPDSQIVTLNVADEMAFGLENFQTPQSEIPQKIKTALALVNAGKIYDRSTLTLSGGEKQKLVIASFLALQSPIILLDEPTARLDPPTTREVLSTLAHLNRASRTTILVVDHRISHFLRIASRCLLMEAGRIVFDGSPSRLRQNPSILQKLGVYLAPIENARYSSSGVGDESPTLAVRELNFSYPKTHASSSTGFALKDISFALYPKEVVGLFGANGSGKTTLLQHLIGLLSQDSGTLELNGYPITGRSVSELARDVGFVFQNPLHQLFERTVWDEMLLASRHLKKPAPDEAEDSAQSLLRNFGLSDFRTRSPFSLSIGEQRRLTIASILVHQPRLLLLDEPFIGLDYRNVHQMMTIIKQLSTKGGAVILATHDPAIIRAYCNRLLFLDEGELVLDAPIHEAFTLLNRLGETDYLPAHLSQSAATREVPERE